MAKGLQVVLPDGFTPSFNIHGSFAAAPSPERILGLRYKGLDKSALEGVNCGSRAGADNIVHYILGAGQVSRYDGSGQNGAAEIFPEGLKSCAGARGGWRG